MTTRRILLLGAIFLGLSGTAQARLTAGSTLPRLGRLTRAAVPRPTAILITPQGIPVGGQWQQWVGEMRVPTVSGPVTLESPAQLCPEGAIGCSQGAPAAWYPDYAVEQAAIAASDRWSLYFELGHQFDFRYLTDGDRAWLARFWRAAHAPWPDSIQALDAGSEDGLEGQFAYAYAICAETGSFFPNSGWPVPAINPRNAWGSCAIIDHIGG